ncbi:MAG: hypothetical protein C4519_28810 [Desulfobacteraceae bacterium]|nr:MAG: hypothetical protein C4519_28810 [Desulfobacteraceae bacterium]
MNRIDCLIERPASVGIAAALLFMALGLIVIGVTVLPFIGILLSIPVFIAAAAFLFSPRSKECTI